jgi:hypothetical protein
MKKPDFSIGSGGLVDPNFLPSSLREELFLQLGTSPLTMDQKKSLITFANDIGQAVMEGELEPGQAQREQIRKVAANARRLLASINALSPAAKQAIQAHSDYLAYGSEPPVQLPEHVRTAIKSRDGSLLSGAWDWIEATEAAAEYSDSQYTVSRQDKPEQMRSRGYVAILAEHVRSMTGDLPPTDRASWFASFVERLSDHLGVPGGPRIVASGIDAAR